MKKTIDLIEKYLQMSIYEDSLKKEGALIIAGIDEAGRGPLAGPVAAAAVILSNEYQILGLDDSKKLSSKKRDLLFDQINEKALAVSVFMCDEKEIDELNILQATKKAMFHAVKNLTVVPNALLLDAVKLDYLDIRQISLIKGDSLSVSIAAASIIAKVTRDRAMEEYHETYPQYNFAKHKGYGTKEHIEAIKKYGPCPIHRLSFIKNFVWRFSIRNLIGKSEKTENILFKFLKLKFCIMLKK